MAIITGLVVAALWAAAVFAALFIAPPHFRSAHMTHMGSMLFWGLFLSGVAWAVAKLVGRLRHVGYGADQITRGIADPKTAALLIGTLFLSRAAASIASEPGYYLILIIFGILLRSWRQSRGYVPVLGAALLLLCSCMLQVMTRLGTSRLGPEAVIFAGSDFAGMMGMLPLDIAVAWGTWRLIHSARTMPETGAPSPAPAEPAPNASA